MKYLLFGTGDYYERYKKWFSPENTIALLDNAPDKQNTFLDGIRVLSPEQGVELVYDAIVILSFYVKAMRRQLVELGVPEEKIYHFHDLNKLLCYNKDGSAADYKKPIRYYGGAEHVEKSSCILLLSHDLMLGGASLALYHMARAHRAQGEQIVFASTLDGPLRDILLSEDIPVIVDVNLQIETMRQAAWTAEFSRIVCNTVNFYVFLSERDTQIPVVWWLHDSRFFYDGVDPRVLRAIKQENLQIYAVGPVPRDALAEFLPEARIGNLLYGVADEAGNWQNADGKDAVCAQMSDDDSADKVCFVTIGYIEPRKGQDILVEAVQKLPREIRARARFYLVGQNTSRMAGEIRQVMEEIPEIIMTGTMDRNGIHAMLERSDAMICPSREDPMPTVAAEAMMHRVPCILSDAAGTAAYIQDKTNGIVFQSEDAQELADQITWCIEHRAQLDEMGLHAREVFERRFSMDVFASDVKRIMSDFYQTLLQHKEDKIAIYGLGAETEKILAQIGGEFHIVGLLDGYRKDGELYGMPIIPMEQAVREKVGLILAAARPGSCRAIARRIGKVCMENGIALFDTRGNDLCDTHRVTYQLDKNKGMTKEQLYQQTAMYEAVSFDLFDTLIMRRILSPSDVFDLVDARLRQDGIVIEDFAARRMSCEKELSKDRAPRLTEIYSYMTETYHISKIRSDDMAVLEWEIDCSLVIPRREVCELLLRLAEQGKKIYIVSDSYYSREQITELMKKCGITRYSDVFVSCEFGTGKGQLLFEKVKEAVGNMPLVHIGDDAAVDIESAEKNGIRGIRIYSGMDLLEMTGYMGLWDYTQSLADRIKTGMFTAKIFNSPFQFETEECKISVDTAYDIGYVFFAPMISDFVLWFHEKVEEYGLQNILFCARDGYLLQKMYGELDPISSTVYFLTSRTAAIRAGMETREDIEYVGAMKFSGSLHKQLQERFGIVVDPETFRTDPEPGLLDYEQEILEKAGRDRVRYQTYIEQLALKEGDSAFFDFVAKGTTQMYMGKLMKQHLKGLYFLRLEEEQMRDKGLDIDAFYDISEMAGRTIFNDYYILETMLTSPMPSVKEFDGQGSPVYAAETRAAQDIQCFLEAQEGIGDYFREYLKICPLHERVTDKRLDEVFLALIHGIAVRDENFLSLKVEDPFFNRMTDMTDLL